MDLYANISSYSSSRTVLSCSLLFFFFFCMYLNRGSHSDALHNGCKVLFCKIIGGFRGVVDVTGH